MQRNRRLILCFLALFLLVATNPGFDRHKEKIAGKIREREGIIAATLGALRNEFGFLQYKSYGVCSVTTDRASHKLVSLGALGMVEVFNP